MKLKEMNNLSSSKLNSLMKQQIGWNFKNLDKMSNKDVSKLIESVTAQLSSIKKSSKLYESHTNNNYNGLLLAKKVLEKRLSEEFNKKRSKITESDISQAETLMAARDLVDSLQSMLEEVGSMINEKIPPLVDTLRSSYSESEAQSFSNDANETLNALLSSVRSARESLDKAVRRVNGENVDTEMSIDDGDDELDDLDNNFSKSDAAVGGDDPLGRPERT